MPALHVFACLYKSMLYTSQYMEKLANYVRPSFFPVEMQRGSQQHPAKMVPFHLAGPGRAEQLHPRDRTTIKAPLF